MNAIHLLVIDPQNDFCDPNGSLFVPGADEDMRRLAGLLERLQGRIADIHVTLDSHRKVDISHPIWWVDPSGAHPDSFATISADDVRKGQWRTTRPGLQDRSLAYLETLEANARYPHVIWPEHCLIGDAGHNIYPALAQAIHAWEDRFAQAEYVTKGSNPWTEHFSAVKAEVPDPEDPSTQLNTQLVSTLEAADIILLAGEARSHCLANTVRDIAGSFSDPAFVQKLVLLTDASSDVAGFSGYGDAFLKDLTRLGMQTATTTDFLA